MGLGAAGWCSAALLWLTGADVSRFALLMAGFLLLTIVGERLELTHATRRSAPVRRPLLAAIAVFACGLGISIFIASPDLRIAGVGLFAQAVGWRATTSPGRRVALHKTLHDARRELRDGLSVGRETRHDWSHLRSSWREGAGADGGEDLPRGARDQGLVGS
jgi:hypothetical protein